MFSSEFNLIIDIKLAFITYMAIESFDPIISQIESISPFSSKLAFSINIASHVYFFLPVGNKSFSVLSVFGV